MADNELVDEEPEGDGSQSPVTPKGRRSFRLARRELTDDELSGSGVLKMMLDEIDRLESDCYSFREVSSRYHSVDRQVAVLEEKLKQKTAFDILTSGALAVGSVLAGFAPSLWSKSTFATFFVGGIGIILIGVGVMAKVRER